MIPQTQVVLLIFVVVVDDVFLWFTVLIIAFLKFVFLAPFHPLSITFVSCLLPNLLFQEQQIDNQLKQSVSNDLLPAADALPLVERLNITVVFKSMPFLNR